MLPETETKIIEPPGAVQPGPEPVAAPVPRPMFTCRVCGSVSEYEPVPFCGAYTKYLIPSVCDSCNDKVKAEAAAKAAAEEKAMMEAEEKRREARWLKICPPLFRAADPALLPAGALAKLPAIIGWKYGPRGLILHGVTRKGKTFCAWLLLRRLYFEDRIDLEAWDAGDWVNACSSHFRDGTGEDWTDRQIHSPLLFLDDLGNHASGERGEGELFRVIKRRGEEMLPIIVTTNKTGNDLRARFRQEDRGTALTRRLAEFCEPVGF